MRVTTHGTLLSYKSNLMRSTNQLNSARNKVLTQRNFNSFAEDPAMATMAFKMRRQFSQTQDQIGTSKAMVSKFESAWQATGKMKGFVEEATKEIALRGGTDSTAAGRQPLGEVLNGTANSIVQTLNAQYGDQFIFGGTNADTAPFSWDSASGELLFQGIPVDKAAPGAPKGTPPNPSDKGISAEWSTYYKENPEYAKLAQMTHETLNVDIGTGLSFGSDNEINSASVFNGAISGVGILGFGVDDDGDPKNAVSLIKKLSDIYKGCDPDSGEYASATDKADADRLTKKLEGALASVSNQWTALDGKSSYLNTNLDRLKGNADTLNEQILSLEQVDLADAITEFSWAQYCYNSALKVGNSLLSQSLIDYMN